MVVPLIYLFLSTVSYHYEENREVLVHIYGAPSMNSRLITLGVLLVSQKLRLRYLIRPRYHISFGTAWALLSSSSFHPTFTGMIWRTDSSLRWPPTVTNYLQYLQRSDLFIMAREVTLFNKNHKKNGSRSFKYYCNKITFINTLEQVKEKVKFEGTKKI